MKTNQIKSLVKLIIKEMIDYQDSELKKTAEELDNLSKELSKHKFGTKEFATISDEYTKLWWKFKKQLNLKETFYDTGFSSGEYDPELAAYIRKEKQRERRKGPGYRELKFPCPDCGKENAISQWHIDKGYHCDDCTRNLEGPGKYY